MKILLTQPLPAAIVERFQATLSNQAELAMVSSFDEAEFARQASDAEVLLNGFRKVDAKLLAMAPRVRFIQQISVGYDVLDLAAIAQVGAVAANTPGANTPAVAEHTVMLMLTLLKRFSFVEQAARANKWPTIALLQAGIQDLSTATVGLVGLGAIGQAVAQRLGAFGPRLLYTARHRVEQAIEERLGVEYMSLTDLLANSSIVSLHLPLSQQTRHLIGQPQLAQMKPGAFLINTARGGLIDEVALRQALESGTLAGAGLDVLEHENDGGNPFTDLSQVIVTPHVAGHSPSAMNGIFRMALANVSRYVSGQTPLYLLSEQAVI